MAHKQRNSRKKQLGAYPYTSVVFSITLALLMLGTLGMLVIYSQKLSALIKEQVQVQVYLTKNVSGSQKIRVLKSLEQYDFVAKNQANEPRISFVSKDEAAKNFIEETGEDFVGFLGENPLHDVYSVNIDVRYQTESKMKEIQKKISQLPGIFEVEYVPDLVQSIDRNISKISLILLGFAVILILVVVVLINNTIKLALFSQRFLIRSMQLVGAKRSFVRKPFIFRSILHGLISGIFASIILFSLSEYANTKIPDLILLKDVNLMMGLAGILVLLGIMLAFFSTLTSVNKYLKLSLDELY